MSQKWLVDELAKLGYEIDESMSFNYFNNLNPPEEWNARSCYLREKDTKLSAFNVNARRDENFKRLQAFRLETYVIKNRVYEL